MRVAIGKIRQSKAHETKTQSATYNARIFAKTDKVRAVSSPYQARTKSEESTYC